MRSRYKRNSILLLAVLLLSACGGGGGGGGSAGGGGNPPVVVDGTGPERIDSAVAEVRSDFRIPGVAVAVVRNGRLVIAKAFGTADIAGQEPLRPDHLFRVASVSKSVTGIAALKAADEGLLDLQAHAFSILDDYRPPPGEGDARLADITVWHLMHHTPGWNLWGFPLDPILRNQEIADEEMVPSPPDSDTLTRWVAKQPLAYEPGTRFSYTNIGFIVLGRVIEKSTGFAYEDFVRRFVFEPAGITRARVGGIGRADRLPDEVEYLSLQDSVWASVFDGNVTIQEPAYGGLNLPGFDASSAWVMSVVDMVRLAAATDGDPAYTEVLTSQRQEQMIAVGTQSGQTAYGAGWFLTSNVAGQTVAWQHSGGMPGTATLLARLENGVIFAVAANADARGQIAQPLLSAVSGAVTGIRDWPTQDLFDQYP